MTRFGGSRSTPPSASFSSFLALGPGGSYTAAPAQLKDVIFFGYSFSSVCLLCVIFGGWVRVCRDRIPPLSRLAKIEVLVHCIVGRGFCWSLLLDAFGCLTGVGLVCIT